ncbi:NADPH-dependent F420 reductase [Rothia nasimurium]|uniref:NADPH-dependent F420 reductase n=1 Tax=Rothia nasimurium TaxID=85336 RepID=UPI001F4110EB|nr:NAD(P)-binding domain-containing protein [Rothia nasimurium]
MTTAIIGTGRIGSQVALRLARGGEEILVAESNFESAQKSAQELGLGIRAGTVEQVIDEADTVVFATMFPVTQQLLQEHSSQLVDKVVVDPSNNFRAADDDRAVSANPEGSSAGQQNAALLLPQGVHFVKALGTMSAANRGKETTGSGEKVAQLFATDDPVAQERITHLLRLGGWEPVKAGGLDIASRIEVGGAWHDRGGLSGRILSKEEAEKLVSQPLAEESAR